MGIDDDWSQIAASATAAAASVVPLQQSYLPCHGTQVVDLVAETLDVEIPNFGRSVLGDIQGS